MVNKTVSQTAKQLRRKAEEIDRETVAQTPEIMDALSPEAAWQVIHELRVHQIELELQNEELRRTQAELQASRESYFDLFDLAPVGYLALSGTGLILEANLSVSTLMGLKRRALFKQPLSRFIFPEDQEKYHRKHKLLTATGAPQVCELRLVKTDGTERWIRLEANLAKDGKGEPVIRAVVNDIGERKQLEEELRDSESKYRRLFEMESDALFLIDAQSGEILDANLAAAELYGYSLEALLQMRTTDLSAEPEETRKADDTAASSGVVLIPVRYHRKKDGKVFPVEITATSLQWKGRPAVIPAIRDITGRMLADAALRKNEEQLREVLENSLDASYKRNLQNNSYEYMSPVFGRISGYTQEEMGSLPVQTVLDSMHPDDLAEIERVLAESLTGKAGTPYSLEYRFKHKTGIYRWFRDKFTIQRDAEGLPQARIGSVSDITERKQMEESLSRDIEMARRVQWELLPDLPESPFVTLRTLYYPSNIVSGDSYHLEWRNQGTLLRGFLLDVSGHGLSTALQTASITVLLRESYIAQWPLPRQLKWVNERAAKYFTEGAYAAILGFELDFSLRELRYVGAGITQFHANGREIAIPGMFVGLWEDAEFMEGKIAVSDGDSFCFLTDGFTDVLTKPENAGFWSPEGTDFDADVAALERLGESGRLRDDATGVCLKINGDPNCNTAGESK